MSSQTQAASPVPATSLGAVPRWIWMAGGAMGLATAGLAGALVMKTVGGPNAAPAPTPIPLVSAPAPALAVAPVPAPTLAAAPVAAPAAAPKKVASAAAEAPHPKPAPRRSVHHETPPAPASSAVAAAAPPAHAAQAAAPAPREPVHTVVCGNCGVVEAVHPVQVAAPATGVGAIAGGLVGGLLANHVGEGTGRKLATVAGAIGGGVAGNLAEQRLRSQTEYEVQLRMEDGSRRTLRQAQPPVVGARVVVEGQTLRPGQPG